jgi:elongation factor G
METVIVYRNTEKGVVLDKESTGEGRFIRQASSIDRYGHVILKIEPMKNGNTQSVFTWEVSEEEIPFAFFDATLSGVKNYFEKEEFPGTHLSGARIRIVGGSFNPVDSSAMCYWVAAMLAIKEALQKIGIVSEEKNA